MPLMPLLIIHIVAGLLGLTSGAVALCTRKGGKLHRQSGMVFVCSMLALSTSGATIAALQSQKVNIIAGMLTFYLVTTALLTVHRPVMKHYWVDAGAMMVGLVVGVISVSFGVEALSSTRGTIDGYPPAIVFIFGGVALLATLGDARMLLARVGAGGIQVANRLGRHLWRMCFAMWLATSSFFLGQAKLFPEPIRSSGILAIPVVLVLVLMAYWLVRVMFMQWRPTIRRG